MFCSEASLRRRVYIDNFPWVLEHQNIEDMPARKRMITSIRRLLEKKSGKKWLSKSKLDLVKRIELNLYESCFTLEEYSDLSTLKERIIALARKALVSQTA
ncbi:predicted protein [Chaetoceros tenuissimus]|uniref:Uncharacterized protein n=1 Tax=Chaetoceros tenuissimus TaxID=426638 RepID=A0AAD3D832_9STRA|nr:predicted protein [Chaetoceros tenuissimus]